VFTLFAEYLVAVSALYFLVLLTALRHTVWDLNIQKAVSESIAVTLLMSCYLIFNDDILFSQSLSFNSSIINGPLTFFSKFLTCFFSAIFFFIIADFLEDQKLVNFEYLLILLFAVLGLMLLCSSYDLLTSYLSIELISLSSYLLAAFRKDSFYSVEAGLKYFITGSVSSAFFLLGSSFIYACSGSIFFSDLWDLFNNKIEYAPTYFESLKFYEDFIAKHFGVIDLEEAFRDHKSSSALLLIQQLVWYHEYGVDWQEVVAHLLAEEHGETIFKTILNDKIIVSLTPLDISSFRLVQIGVAFILFSIFIKLALAPFHLWSLDVYEGSPTSSTFFFAVITKLSFFIFLIRFCYVAMFSFSDDWQFYLICVSLISVFVGSIGGVTQHRLKTLLAYSSVSHMGYSMLALCTVSLYGIQMLLFYLTVYTLSGVCTWYIIMLLKLKTSNDNNKKYSKELTDLSLLNKANPGLALALSITMFSLAGLPPFVGFIAKLGIFLTLLNEKFYFLCVFSMLCSVISTFYYIRIVKIMYFENILIGKLYYPIKTNKVILLSFFIFMHVFLFINPSLLFLIIQDVVYNSLM
jgi:NADH:ubiquinone oxidoreductase subunit 2 (subunit N)